MTDIYLPRRRTLQWMMIAVVSIFILRLFYLQIIDKENQQLAKANVLRETTVYPARGLVYDRNGKLIIDNQKEYDLWVVPDQVHEMDTSGFCQLVGIPDSVFKSQLQKAFEYSRFKPSLFVKSLSVDQYAAIEEELYLFTGFYGQVRTVRAYPYDAGAQLLGYISEVTPKQMSEDNYYRQGDYIGTGGLEQSYEKDLRGEKGTKYILVDVHNREMGSFDNGKFDTLAVPGKNIRSTIDIDMQQYGEQLMQGKSGSIVAIDPKTGEVLCMVSSPTYNPNLLTGQERGNNFAKLLTDSTLPLFVRPLKAAYPPGSTYKPALALIGLQLGSIKYNSSYECPGGYIVGKLEVKCDEKHGLVPNLETAIQVSCNTYFCNYFRKTIDDHVFDSVAGGLNYWKSQLNYFNLGKKTGIDLPNEGYGFIPGASYYNKIYGRNHWNSVTIVSDGIGQGELGETPLQIATLATAIANGGYYFTPHVVKNIEGDDTILSRFSQKHIVPIDSDNFKIVKQGMQLVVEAGTASASQIPGVMMAGKTGTAQNPHGKDHSLFMAYAPADDPQIAIAVVVENAGFGAQYAAPIASLIIEKYLKGSIDDARKPLEQAMMQKVITP